MAGITLDSNYRLESTITIEPGETASGVLAPGQILSIIDVEGGQVCDFSSFSSIDPKEYCDLIYSLFAKEVWKLSVGDVLYTKHMRPLWTIIADTCGVHEWTGGFCSHDLNSFLGFPMVGCRDRLEDELVAHNLTPDLLVPSSCINPFMNMIRHQDGRWTTEQPVSKAGDSLVLRAEMSVLWMGTVCMMPPPTNRLPLTPIRFEIYTLRN